MLTSGIEGALGCHLEIVVQLVNSWQRYIWKGIDDLPCKLAVGRLMLSRHETIVGRLVLLCWWSLLGNSVLRAVVQKVSTKQANPNSRKSASLREPTAVNEYSH